MRSSVARDVSMATCGYDDAGRCVTTLTVSQRRTRWYRSLSSAYRTQQRFDLRRIDACDDVCRRRLTFRISAAVRCRRWAPLSSGCVASPVRRPSSPAGPGASGAPLAAASSMSRRHRVSLAHRSRRAPARRPPPPSPAVAWRARAAAGLRTAGSRRVWENASSVSRGGPTTKRAAAPVSPPPLVMRRSIARRRCRRPASLTRGLERRQRRPGANICSSARRCWPARTAGVAGR